MSCCYQAVIRTVPKIFFFFFRRKFSVQNVSVEPRNRGSDQHHHQPLQNHLPLVSSNILLLGLLDGELPRASQGVSLAISPPHLHLDSIFFLHHVGGTSSSLCFLAALKTCHSLHSFNSTWYLVPILNNTIREEVSSPLVFLL
jgi:hypothetical protein